MKYGFYGLGALCLTALVSVGTFSAAAADASGPRGTLLTNKQLDRVSAGLGLLDALAVDNPVVDPTIAGLGGIGVTIIPTCSGCASSNSTSSSSNSDGTIGLPFGLGLGVTGTTLGAPNVPSVIVTPFGIAILP
jgi:hypothetical protein